MDLVAELEALMEQPPGVADVVLAARQRPAWHADAACAGMGTSVFFPERPADVRAAKAVCATCPVTSECAEFANASGGDRVMGIWGGMSGQERRAARRRHTAA